MSYAEYRYNGDYREFDDPYYSCDPDRPKCSSCDDINQKFDGANDFLKGVVDQLYGFEDFNRELLDSYLEELCWYLNVKKPTTELTIHSIKTKQDKVFNFALNMARELNTGNLYPTTL